MMDTKREWISKVSDSDRHPEWLARRANVMRRAPLGVVPAAAQELEQAVARMQAVTPAEALAQLELLREWVGRDQARPASPLVFQLVLSLINWVHDVGGTRPLPPRRSWQLNERTRT